MKSTLLCASIIALTSTFSAFAQMPSIRFDDGVPISPNAASSYYNSLPGGLASRSAKTAFDPRIEALSHGLRGDAELIYAYIQNNIVLTPHFGLQKGAVGALLDWTGTSFDQAELMVDLVRAAGGEARYAGGVVSLSTAEIRAIYGLNDYVNLSDFFADGGIPAVVHTGGADIEHIWVEVRDSDGNWTSYDPSFKRHDWFDGVDASTLAGISGGSAINSVLAGASRGGSSAPWIQNVTIDGASAQLDTYSTTLLNTLEGSDTYASLTLEEFTGGRVISRDPIDLGAYTTSYTWAGDIPDSLRTRLDIYLERFSTTAPFASVFVDEYYGTRITLRDYALNGGHASEIDPGLGVTPYTPASSHRSQALAGHISLNQLDYLEAAGDPDDYLIATADREGSHSAYLGPIRLVLDAPYAADNGTYMDIDYSTYAHEYSQNEIFVIAGEITQRHVGQYEAAANSDTSRREYDNDEFFRETCAFDDPAACPGATYSAFPELHYWEQPWAQGLQLSLDRDFQWRRLGAQREFMSRFIESAAEVEIGHHFSIGVATGGGNIATTDSMEMSWVDGFGPAWLDQVSVLSTQNRSNNAEPDAAEMAFTSMTALLEHSVVQLQSLEVAVGDYMVRDKWASSALLALLTSDARYTHYAPGSFTTTGLPTDYASEFTDVITNYSSDGYAVILATNSYSPGFFAIRDGEMAYLVYDSLDRVVRKGGGGAAPGQISVPRMETPSAMSHTSTGHALASQNVSMLDGSFTYTPAPDVIAGGGAFPHALPYQRTYSSRAGRGAHGVGWSNNWEIYAGLHHGVNQLTSSRDPRHTVPSIVLAELMVMAADDFSTLDAVVAMSQLGSAWMQDYAVNGVISIHSGNSNSMFVRLADGSWDNLTHDRSELVQLPDSGDYINTEPSQCCRDNFDLQLTTPDGQTLTFEAVTARQFDWYFGRAESYLHHRYPITRWEFPTGVQIDFDYREKTGTLSRVSNNLGWILDFELEENVCFDNGQAWDYTAPGPDQASREAECRRLNRVFDLVQSVTARHSNSSIDDHSTATFEYLETNNGWVHRDAALTEVRNPASGAGIFRYTYDQATGPGTQVWSAPVVGELTTQRLAEIYLPNDAQTPYLTVEYDRSSGLLLDQVREIALRNGTNSTVSYNFHVSGGRAETLDPLGFTSGLVHYDTNGRIWRDEVPARGLISHYVHDGRGRLTQSLSFEDSTGASQYLERLSREYDLEDNLTQETAYPRAGMSDDPLVTLYTYDDPNWPHLVTSVTDPLGNVSTTQYDAATGQILVEEGPSGERVEYEYTPLGLVSEIRTLVEQ